MKLLNLAKELINFKTVTPDDKGIMAFIEGKLKKIGFERIIIEKFSDINEKAKETLNLYGALFDGNGGKNLCFGGHVDVVPEGKEHLWRFPPFEATVEDGVLYGRGASDMKTAIAAFIIAAEEFLTENKGFNKGNISLLLTGDEEGDAINGTKKMLKHIEGLGVKLTNVLVGEPTSELELGDVIKHGRRGSISFNLEITGVQGHIAYPHLAKNPIPELAKIVCLLSALKLDEGNSEFAPSSLQIVKVGPEFGAENVIPSSAACFFNIRFNNLQKGEKIVAEMKKIISENTNFNFKLSHTISGEAFLSEKTEFNEVVFNSVKEILGIEPKFSTSGGTSDARFIKDYAPVLELGVLNKTAHKIDEHVAVKDLQNLKEVYKKILYKYFI